MFDESHDSSTMRMSRLTKPKAADTLMSMMSQDDFASLKSVIHLQIQKESIPEKPIIEEEENGQSSDDRMSGGILEEYDEQVVVEYNITPIKMMPTINEEGEAASDAGSPKQKAKYVGASTAFGHYDQMLK